MNIIDTMTAAELFVSWFGAPSWHAWASFLRVLFALPLDEDDAITYQKHTGRTERPAQSFRESWIIAGRQSGKSWISALIATYTACLVDWSPHVRPGEFLTVAVVAADRDQAKIVFGYIRGLLSVPVLTRLIVNETKERIELRNGVAIEVRTCSFRTIRGRRFAALVMDEVAFWRDENSANPAGEILAAARPGMSTVPGSLLIAISSPYSRSGPLWDAWQRYYGTDDPHTLVWKADSLSMNPSLDRRIVDLAYEQDPAAAKAEYGAEFRDDLESFVKLDAVRACVVKGLEELRKPLSFVDHFAFVDAATGSGQDSFTIAITYRNGATRKAVLGMAREVKPPFAPSVVVAEFARLARRFHCPAVIGDNFAGAFCQDQFRSNGIGYKVSELSRSDLYAELLPAINSGLIELPDNPRLIAQLVGLERRVGRSGRDSIDHSPGSHDDLANAAAGALVAALHPSAVARGLSCQIF